MIPQLCFLQWVTLVRQTPKTGLSTTHSSKPSQTNLLPYGFGMSIAVLLHLLVFMLLNVTHPQANKNITAPRLIEVSWINAESTQAVSQPAAKPQQQPQKPQPRTKAAEPAKPVKKAELISQNKVPSTASEAPPPSEPQPAELTPVASNNAANPTTSATIGSASSAVQNESAPLIMPHLNADYLDNPRPNYPTQSRLSGEQGRVLLRVYVNGEGYVEQLMLHKSSGYARLDEAALDSVKQWRFAPAKRGQQAVSAWVVVPVSFSLEG